jgi:hypothetical protein
MPAYFKLDKKFNNVMEIYAEPEIDFDNEEYLKFSNNFATCIN